jgi:hypothetical protein
MGVLANGARVHRFTSIVLEGQEFIDFYICGLFNDVITGIER